MSRAKGCRTILGGFLYPFLLPDLFFEGFRKVGGVDPVTPWSPFLHVFPNVLLSHFYTCYAF